MREYSTPERLVVNFSETDVITASGEIVITTVQRTVNTTSTESGH